MSNTTRHKWRQTYGMSACDSTKCPKLDTTLRAEVPKACKDGDRPLSHIQTLVLDAVGPLSSLLELQSSGSLTVEAAVEATTHALRFLGNASAMERRKRAANHLNKDLQPLVEKSDRFTSEVPYLFGKDFEKATKHHIDSVKSLRKVSQHRGPGQMQRPGRPYNYQQQTARGGSPYRGGSRGGGRGHFRPYQNPREKENQNQETTAATTVCRTGCSCSTACRTGTNRVCICVSKPCIGNICTKKRNFSPLLRHAQCEPCEARG